MPRNRSEKVIPKDVLDRPTLPGVAEDIVAIFRADARDLHANGRVASLVPLYGGVTVAGNELYGQLGPSGELRYHEVEPETRHRFIVEYMTYLQNL